MNHPHQHHPDESSTHSVNMTQVISNEEVHAKLDEHKGDPVADSLKTMLNASETMAEVRNMVQINLGDTSNMSTGEVNAAIEKVVSPVEPTRGAIYYPAVFQWHAGDAEYTITFRDVPEAITQGSGDNAISMAEDALLTSMDFYIEAKRPLPEPSILLAGERLIHLVGGYIDDNGLIAIDEKEVTAWRLKPENALALVEIEKAEAEMSANAGPITDSMLLDGAEGDKAAFNKMITGDETVIPTAAQIEEHFAGKGQLATAEAAQAESMLNLEETIRNDPGMIRKMLANKNLPRDYQKQLRAMLEKAERNAFNPGALVSRMRDPNKIW